MKVYIIRHGQAAERDGQRYPDDDQRPLTPEGMARFQEAVRGLRRLDMQVSRVISSPVLRARQTAELLVEGLRLPKGVLELSDRCRYDAHVQATWEEIRRRKSEAALALVGHEPHLSELISFLIAGDAGCRVVMKKGACACVVANESLQPGGLELRWLLTQKQLALLAR